MPERIAVEFRPDASGPQLRGYGTIHGERKAISGHEKCGFPAISFAIKNRDRLSPEVRSALEIVLQRPMNQKSILWEPCGFITIRRVTTPLRCSIRCTRKFPGTADQYADSVASIANYCATFETQVLGISSHTFGWRRRRRPGTRHIRDQPWRLRFHDPG